MQSISKYSQLEGDLFFLDDSPLECEPMTQLISFYLSSKGLTHTRMIGSVKDQRHQIEIFPHCWIQLPCGAVIDFRLRMWTSANADMPHGIFMPEPTHLCYVGDNYLAPALNYEEAILISEGRMLELVKQPKEGSHEFDF